MNYCLSLEAGENTFPHHLEAKTARELLLNLPVSLSAEKVQLGAALERVLAKDICAAFPMPPFRKSPFDGYAIRSKDCPGRLSVARMVAAGDSADFCLAAGEAVRIFTGSPVPKDADAVLKQEDVQAENGCVIVKRAIAPDINVIHVGEDYPEGKLLAKAGATLTAAALGVLASQGYAELPVYKRPVVSLISTGSELTEPGDVRGQFKIYNSSAASICAFLQKQGLESRYLGIVPDVSEKIIERVSNALENSDVVITTGGASVGDFDFALDTAAAVGAQSLFWKVNMKPGGAILASVRGEKLLLSLSGNPAAAMMGLLLIALPYLKKLCGKAELLPEVIRLPLSAPLPKTSSVVRLLRGHLQICDGAAFFVEHSGRGNGNLASFENCDLIGVIPPDSGELEAGYVIDAVRIE